VFKSHGSLLLGAATFLAFGTSAFTSGAADANVVAGVGTSSVLAATDFNNGSLDFYWEAAGSPSWSTAEHVAGQGTTSSFAAVAQVGNSSVIAAQGPNGLDFYWQAIGSPTWSPAQVVAGVDATQGTPAIAQVGQSTVIAAQTPSGQINFYYQPIGSPTWSKPQQVTGSASGSPAGTYGYPAVTQVGNAAVIVAQGPGATLWMFWEQIGSAKWTAEKVAGANSTDTQPSVAQVGQSTVIAAGGDNTLYTYSQPIGGTTWTPDAVTTDSEGFHDPSITQVGNAAVVAVYRDELNSQSQIQTSLYSYVSTPIGNATWTPHQVTQYGPFNGGGDPTIAQVDGSAVIGVPLSNGTGLFYWESGWNWHPETVG
jgi:hypothetical protein